MNINFSCICKVTVLDSQLTYYANIHPTQQPCTIFPELKSTSTTLRVKTVSTKSVVLKYNVYVHNCKKSDTCKSYYIFSCMISKTNMPSECRGLIPNIVYLTTHSPKQIETVQNIVSWISKWQTTTTDIVFFFSNNKPGHATRKQVHRIELIIKYVELLTSEGL